jgi:hypothetical protein
MIVGESGKQEQEEEGVSGDGMWPCWWGIRVRNSNPSSMPPPDHMPPVNTSRCVSTAVKEEEAKCQTIGGAPSTTFPFLIL